MDKHPKTYSLFIYSGPNTNPLTRIAAFRIEGLGRRSRSPVSLAQSFRVFLQWEFSMFSKRSDDAFDGLR